MSKVVTIPTCMNPFLVEINGKRYEYPAGTEQEVPDEVAFIIEQHINLHTIPEPEPPEPEAAPVTSWNDLTDKPFDANTTYVQYGYELTGAEGTTGYHWTNKTNEAYNAISEEDKGIKVVWDGVEYFGTMHYEENPGLGDRYSFAGDTGAEPFEFYGDYYYQDDAYFTCIGANDQSSEHTFEIFLEEETVKTLDPTYLPKAAAVADVTDAPTADQFNALLASLRAAGYLAT